MLHDSPPLTSNLPAAPLPPSAGSVPLPGTPLPGGLRVVGAWRGVAVIARSYPVSKGGPLGWEVQLEEMANCAEQLASGTGLVALRRRPSDCAWQPSAGLPPSALGVACPDYEFFASRMRRG